jgi:hypothetical protein
MVRPWTSTTFLPEFGQLYMGLKKATWAKHMLLWANFFFKKNEVTTNMTWEGRNTDFGSTCRVLGVLLSCVANS